MDKQIEQAKSKTGYIIQIQTAKQETIDKDRDRDRDRDRGRDKITYR